MTVKKLLTVVQVLLILVFLGCGGYTAKYFYDSHKAQKAFEELKEETQANDGGAKEERAKNGMLKKYAELYERNPDMTGWLTVTGTPIDYPIVRGADNDYYLHKNFDKEYQFSGIPFADYQCSDGTVNTIIYAHNMKDGTMFAALADYENRAFYETHKNIKYDTLYNKGEYEIIAAFTTKVGAKNEFKYYEYADIGNKEEFNEYVNTARSLSFYDVGSGAVWGDKLLTLSTCAYHTSNERFVVVAKKI